MKSSVGAGLLLTSNLVAKALRLDDGDVIDDALVEVEVLRQPAHGQDGCHLLSVVLLDDGSGGSLDGLGSNTSHDVLRCK